MWIVVFHRCLKNGYNLPKSIFYEDHWGAATVGRDTSGYAIGFFLFFNVTTSLAIEHMVSVGKWNVIFSALEKLKLF